MAVLAEHQGTCPACDGRYAERTPIRRRELGTPREGWGHDVCPDPLAVEHPPCSACFLVHPAGTCDR